MRYNNRDEVERIGRAGSYFETGDDGIHRARVMSSFWLCCDPTDKGFTPHQTVKADGFWESWITYWMTKNVAPGSNCIDIGANHGYYTMLLLEHGCNVRSVEPQSRLADLIEMSVRESHFNLDTGTVDRVALSDEGGVTTIIVPEGHGMNASIAYDPGGVGIEVMMCTLDDFCEGRQHYDFVKVDVEGAEAKLFRGGWKFIEENPDCVFLVEWRNSRMNEDESKTVAKQIFDKFKVWWVDVYGNEHRLVDPAHLRLRIDEDWELVLRRKK